MQRYRVNYRLFIGLIVGAVVAAGAVYGAWQFNTSRNADNLLERANKAEKLEEATKLLESYVALQPDDSETQIRLGFNYVELSKKALEAAEYGLAMNYRKNASTKLARYPDEHELRRALVDLDLLPRSFSTSPQFNTETTSHIKTLLGDSPDDVDLIEGLAQCSVFQKKPEEAAAELNKIVGYDPSTGNFDTSKALDPQRLSAYQTYAFAVAYAIPRSGDPLPTLNNFALSRKLVDQMVAVNPDDAEAYLARAQWFAMHDRGKDSRQDFEANTRQDVLKAVELDPKSTAAIQAVAAHFLQLGIRARDEMKKAEIAGNVQEYREREEESKENFNIARDYLRQGLELDGSNANFYVRLAALERHTGDKDEAYRIINEGLGQLTGQAKVFLEMTHTEYLLEDGNIGEAEKLIRQFASTRPATDPALMFLQAKHALFTENWRKVRDLAKELLPMMAGNQDRQLNLYLWLGFAHEKLAEPELAQENFQQVLALDPDNPFAIDKVRRAPASRVARPSRDDKPVAVTQTTLMQQMQEEAKLPESEQNWEPFEKYLLNRSEIEGRSPTRTKMALAELYRFRKKYEESERLLSEALKEASTDPESSEQTDVLLAAINLAATNPKRGPDAAIKMMDGIVAKYGDSPMFRIQRVRLLGARNDENMVADVLALTKDMEGWKPQEIEVMWGAVASVFEQTRNPEQAELALAELAKLREGDLPIRIRMFKSALARSDEEAMKAAQDEILKLVGSKRDPNWAFTEAARLFATGETINEEQRKEVERLLAEILRTREEWHEPYFLRAKLKLTKGDALGAVEDFERGFALGQGTVIDLRVYGQLLVAQNRWREALQLVDKYDEDVRIMILGERYPQALFATERYTDSVEAAERLLAMADPTPELHLWHAQLLASVINLSPEILPADQREAFIAMQKECREKQGAAIDQAIELRPDFPAAWLTKVRHHLANSELDKAIATVQEAQLTIEDDVEPIVAAESYALLGRWFDAQNLYVSIHQQNPDNTTVVRQLATFYLSPLYPRNDKVEKASTLINSVLEKVAKDPKSVPEIDAQWARRTAAQVLAAKQDYQSLLDAEKLLASNSVDGALPVADKAEMAKILAPRPEQVSKRKAIQLLEEIKTQSSLSLQQELMLANLYFETDAWPKARDAMDTLTARHPKSPEVRQLYVRMLMVRDRANERDTLEVQMRQLRSIDPNSLATLELTARAANLAGQSKAARDMLRKVVPADLNKVDAKGIALARQVARLLNELKDVEGAESIYRALAQRDSATVDDKGQLAHFVGVYRDPAAGFEMLENLQHEIDPLALVEASLLITAAHRKDVAGAYDERVERWLNRALREDPESIALSLKQAEFRDQQGRYEESAAIYRKLLENDDLTGRTRAVVLNNLAYMLALGVAKSNSPNEAAEHINEAVRLLGPVSDILDTRAVVYMRRQDFKSAADDLKLAVIDAPTASKYFHLALAHLGLNENSDARNAWEKGEKLGLTRETVNVLEQEKFDEAVAKIKGS